jgi:hypothetical protein
MNGNSGRMIAIARTTSGMTIFSTRGGTSKPPFFSCTGA